MKCNRHFHLMPYCVGDENMLQTKSFQCELCYIDYWPSRNTGISVSDSVSNRTKEPSRSRSANVLDNVSNRTKETHNINLRDIKKKMEETSFKYSPIKRTRLTHCICNKPDDGRVYWQCINCRQWIHPTCIGRDEWDSPEPYLCATCLDKQVNTWSIDHFGSHHQPDSDDEEEEKFLITGTLACREMKAAYIRCSEICASIASKSKVPWLRAHCSFERTGSGHRQVGFGYGIFSQRALMIVENNLIKMFLQRESLYTNSTYVRGLANKTLENLFKMDNTLPYIYIKTVLLREGLIALFQSVTGCDYAPAKEALEVTVAKTTIGALEKAVNNCSKLKTKYRRT